MTTIAITLAAFTLVAQQQQQQHTTWKEYGGTPDASQYSALKQVDKTNVAKLQKAWSYSTGDNNRYFFQPIVVGNVMYVMARKNQIVALDAATGRELWSHTPPPDTRVITNRGINYWESKDGKQRRLLYCSNHELRAINAVDGKPFTDFGVNGSVNLKEGLDRDPKTIALVQSTTPGRVFEDLIILGSATNQGYGSAPGDIRAFDVRTGKLAWTFHTVPRPGEYGYESWPPDAWKRVGGANVWGEMSLDMARGILYAPTASPKYNFWGVDRAGDNLFSDSLLALDARTGKRLWHFQMVHHDIWDYDDATAPKLLTIQHEGKKVDIVAQVTKQGFIWVFDRVTGKPIWPIEEREVPKSDQRGEKVSPTQPHPTKPPAFSRQKFTVDDLSPYLSPQDRAKFRDDILSARNEGLFTPPSRKGTVQMPGNNGGANWGGAAVNPNEGLLYVVSKDLPAMLKLEPEGTPIPGQNDYPEQRGLALYTSNCQGCHGEKRTGNPARGVPSLLDAAARMSKEEIAKLIAEGKGRMPKFEQLTQTQRQEIALFLANPGRAEKNIPITDDTRFYSGFGFMIASDGLSAIKPPWSSLTAYDLNQGVIKWQIPLGDVPMLAEKGIKGTGSHYPKLGPVVTAGGLIFTGTRDKWVRALDAATGKPLWEAEVDAALEGIPAVCEVDGRQYIVFCAAAQVGLTASTQTPIKGAYVAFALPK
ncbi:MAG: PQQ-binding-like beta-propeller repeat protein [Acidobacteria bacterium]|nr:PQQ-binding-like beta-propeller repeat protein [Acidobacteriota bacterium]